MPTRRRHRYIVPLAAVALCALVATLLIAGSADDPGKPGRTRPVVRPFAPNSFWNQPLAAGAPLDPKSAAYVAQLESQLRRWGPWINTTEWSVPVYTVRASQPAVRVQLDIQEPSLQQALDRVPLPADARPAARSDAHLVVWQPARDRMWELWRARRAADGWHASFGGRIDHVSKSPGYYTRPPSWGATATSLPLLGGLIRIDELRAGRIDHALALALPRARAGAFSWPAQRTDGTDPSPDAIPAGTRFRLDPTLDLDAIDMHPVVRQMAEAAQRYGIVVRDTASSVTFYAEDPAPTGGDPYPGFFGGRAPSELLAQFPWQHLRVLRTEISAHPR